MAESWRQSNQIPAAFSLIGYACINQQSSPLPRQLSLHFAGVSEASVPCPAARSSFMPPRRYRRRMPAVFGENLLALCDGTAARRQSLLSVRTSISHNAISSEVARRSQLCAKLGETIASAIRVGALLVGHSLDPRIVSRTVTMRFKR